jgi:hypothetical protein
VCPAHTATANATNATTSKNHSFTMTRPNCRNVNELYKPFPANPVLRALFKTLEKVMTLIRVSPR